MQPPTIVAASFESTQSTVLVRLDVARVTRRLTWLGAAIVVAGVLGHLAVRGRGTGLLRDVGRPFLLDAELAVPAWYSALLLAAIAAAAAWLHTATRDDDPDMSRRWKVIAWLFVYLSLDEAIILHETLDNGLADLFGWEGSLPLWTIPGGIAVMIVGLYVLPLWRSLAPDIRRLFVVALVLYAGGAIGIEVVSRPFFESAVQADLPYLALVTLEEGAEITGASTFLVALFTLIARRAVTVGETVVSA